VYILGAANAITTRELTRADITGIWSGLRPLLAPEQKGASSERTADLSRRHTVGISPGGLITVTGGKLTTYRKMAEDTVDVAVSALGRRGLTCRTKNLRLHGTPPGRRATPKAGGVGANVRPDPANPLATRATHLNGRFGTDASAVLALAEGRPDLLEPLVAGLPYLSVEALYAVQREMARSVSDVLDRRTQSSYRNARAAAEAAMKVAELIGPELGWDAERIRAEADTYARRVRAELARAGLDPGGVEPGGAASGGAGSEAPAPVATPAGAAGAGGAPGTAGA
ncbi:MAG: glycerol-3-phosphate dehydrogenase C-terminal domain-containing protein, partial [Acidimicrobiales bacterium]